MGVNKEASLISGIQTELDLVAQQRASFLAASFGHTKKSIRDTALFALMFDLGASSAAMAGLSLEDLDMGEGSVNQVNLSADTVTYLAAWIQMRGTEPGPLFRNFSHAKKGAGRLTGHGVWNIVTKIGKPRFWRNGGNSSVWKAHRGRKAVGGQRFRIFKRDSFKCRLCGFSATDGVRLVLDHIRPVASGGASDDENIWTLCEPCNQSKSDAGI